MSQRSGEEVESDCDGGDVEEVEWLASVCFPTLQVLVLNSKGEGEGWKTINQSTSDIHNPLPNNELA
jgi:hypothetical protein